MKLPFLQFYPSDYMRDTRALSLAAKGGWVDVLCILHSSSTRGTLTLPVVGWARVMGATVDQAAAVIAELESMQTADVIRDGNGNVTLTNRRMMGEHITREQTRLRVDRHRKKAACNARCNANDTDRSQKSETRNNKSETIPNPPPAEVIVYPPSLDTPEFRVLFDEWMTVRRKGGRPKKPWPEFFARQLTWLDGLGPAGALESVASSIRNGWTGLFEPKGVKPKPAATLSPEFNKF